jgi:hypothetical protein
MTFGPPLSFVGGILLGMGVPVWAEFSSTVLPVPVYIESEEVFTRLHLAMEVEELGFPLVAQPGSTDPELEEMLDFFELLLAGQWEEAEAATLPARDAPPEALGQIFQGYVQLVEGSLDDLRIERQVKLGHDRLLLWSIPLAEPVEGFDRLVRSFRFVREGADGPLRFEGPRRDPFAILITSLYHEAQRVPGGLAPANPGDFEFGYDLPLENNGEPPRFLFNGRLLDTDIFASNSVASDPEALIFYREAMQALASGDPARYGPLFAPESQAKFQAWVAEMEPGSYDAYRDDMLFIGKRIYFMLDAEPVYYFFHLPTFEGVEGASFRYDMVWRSPEGKWEVVNFFIEGYFDDIVKNRGLFEEPFLRPALLAAGLLEDERRPLSIRTAVTDEPGPPAPPAASASASVSTPPVAATPPPQAATRRGLPGWVWALVVLGILGLAYLFYRQRASASDGNSSPS